MIVPKTTHATRKTAKKENETSSIAEVSRPARNAPESI